MKEFKLSERVNSLESPLYIEKGIVNGDVEMHLHDFCEIFFVVSGHAIHTYNDKVSEIGKGDVFVLKGKERHGFAQCRELCLFNVMFRLAHIGDTDDCRSLPGFWALFINEQFFDTLSYEKTEGSCYDKMLRLCEGMLREFTAAQPGYKTVCVSLLMEMIVMLSRNYQSNPRHAETVPLRFSEVMVWIKENYTSPITVEDLAQRAFLSKRHFARLFKRIYGMPPLEYLLELRLKLAAKLLAEEEYNITQVAERCGFSDINYFSKFFKSRYHLSPKKWRETIGNGLGPEPR